MKCLLVIDMQEDYVGNNRNKKIYPYDDKKLIANINKKISEYPDEMVFYIINRFWWESVKTEKRLVDGLAVVSNNIYEKKKKSCFSNKELLEYIKEMNIKTIELIGVDGNYCVRCSALEGLKEFDILFDLNCIGIGNMKKFR